VQKIAAYMHVAHEHLFSMYVTDLMKKAVPDEWIRLKHEFDALVFGEGVAASSIEQTLDEQVRRRFIELINRASERRRKNWI
jgi:hypothetical protein